MAQQRLPMRKIRDVLRLSAAGLSKRQIAASLGIGPTAAGACLRRAREADVGWPLPDDLDDAALESRLYPVPTTTAKDWRSLPDWPAIHRELRRKGVTLQLVWEEYRGAHPDGYGRSWFCELYRAWEGRLSPTMRQAHVAGEKLFVDYAGTTIDIVDATTGEVHACQLFVAALGASSMTYAEATFTQTLPDWIGSHTRAFGFYGGVPAMVVSDNLKSGITKACFYEPGVNRAYAEMAVHYDTAIVPARPRKPRDKTSVSYCTLFWRLRGDGDEPGRAGVAPSAAFEDGLLCGQRPQATIQMVATAFCDQPLTAPLVHGGFRDAKLCSDLACREHATAA